MKTKSVFWGGLFILAGLLLLFNNLGFLNINVWELIWPTFIIAMGVFTLWSAKRGPEALDVEDVSILLDGTRQGKMSLAFGAGQVHVNGKTGDDELLNGTFSGGVEYHTNKDGDFTDLSIKNATTDFFQTIMPWTWGAREWKFGLSKLISWQLHFEMGASDMQIDLSELRVEELEIDTGASNTKIVLPANAGHTHVDLSGGAASVHFEVPEGVAARIQVDSGLASIDINRERFPRVGGYYKSDNYDTAANKVDISADFGAGALSIR
ncbi:MAG: hypothetical protein ISR59_11960 [Anaerolineales bacterium]|uniref:LiaI-LiaF-like transmembrane region domain-containing protein n=1 Tax=Candidatus Desulfolinea nitratireducens TaxID=2841698 RepID=A0A8J6NP97_9CHLR|nr:hypothetical protein [Candidatus Desulfolinea nitratireducens]MBL6961814.1 hypothetical protein [Anaerolineales bacterium]